MKILAIDTATEACSAALLIDADTSDADTSDGGASDNGTNNKNAAQKITSRYQLAPREHSRLILKMIDELLVEAELSVSNIDAIAFGQGPGSFMGLRIAAGVVQGIAFAHDIPVIPISTLKAIAQRAYEKTGDTNVLATIDARMDEVYWAAYSLKNERWQLHDEECVISPDKISVPVLKDDATWLAAGNGWASYKDRLLQTANCKLQTILPDCFPSAEAIAKLAVAEFNAGNTVSATEAIPVYLRNNVAKKPKPVRL